MLPTRNRQPSPKDGRLPFMVRLKRTLQTEWDYRQVLTSKDEGAAALAPC